MARGVGHAVAPAGHLAHSHSPPSSSSALLEARARHPGRPQASMDAPNAVWTVDFKGRFRLGDGQLCYPLTTADGYSRFLLRCDGLTSTAGFAGRAPG